MAVKTGKALEDALRQRAQRGGGVSDPANQAMYDKFRAEYDAEVNRKADNNIALAGNGNGTVSTFNQNLYDARMASNKAAADSSGANTGSGSEVTTSVINPSATATTTEPTNTSMLKTMFDDRTASEMQAQKKARETAQQGLNSIETGAKQTAYQNRNLADAATQQSAQRLREIMADRGLLSSGDNITANVGLQAAGQNALNQINQVEGNTLRDVVERRGIINNNAALDESALLREINAARIAASIEENRYQGNRELQIAGLTGQLGNDRTLAGQTFDWSKDSSNPANVSLQLGNKLAELQLQNYPESVKQQAQLFEQQLKTGQISIETAQYQLKELTDPNSVSNQTAALDLKMKELEATNLPEQYKLQLQQLRKSIEQIGKVQPTSQYETDMQRIKLDTAKAEYDNLITKSRIPPVANLSEKTSTDNYNMLYDDINDPTITKEEARLLLQQNSATLNDSDYKKLNDKINDIF